MEGMLSANLPKQQSIDPYKSQIVLKLSALETILISFDKSL